jgi:hypothetical protein
MARFFISYRREDAAAEAGRLYDLLSEQFGADAVFMDVDTLRPGVDYRLLIERHLEESRALLAVIGRGWLEARDRDGRRRLELADDFVRYEIESALARGVTVLPVLVDGATPLAESSLPASLKSLARLQAVALDTPEFRRDAGPLLETLAGIAGRQIWRRWIRVWPAAAIVTVTALAAGVLMFGRVARAPVEVALRTSQISVTIIDRQPVLTGLSVSRLGVAGVDMIALPNMDMAAHSALLLEGAVPGATISLPRLVLPAGASVIYARGAVPDEVQIELLAPAVEFEASVEGTVRLGLAGAPASVETFEVPGRVAFRGGSNAVALAAMLPATTRVELLRQVKIGALSFSSVEQTTVGDDTTARSVSAIEGGSVAFWPGRGPAIRLAAADWLRLEAPEGTLTSVMFDKDLFTLRFAGTVRNVELGAIGDSSSAMPTYFEAAWAASPASFLMGAVIYVFLALALIVRRPASPS